MFARSILLKIFCISVVLSDDFKHSLPQENEIPEKYLKSYKEDIKSILSRIQRTSENLKLLQDRVQTKELYRSLSDPAELVLRIPNYYPMQQQSLQDKVQLEPASVKRMRRHDSAQSTTPSGIDILDNYTKLGMAMDVEDRNKLKKEAFDEAKEYIATVIKHLDPGIIPSVAPRSPPTFTTTTTATVPSSTTPTTSTRTTTTPTTTSTHREISGGEFDYTPYKIQRVTRHLRTP